MSGQQYSGTQPPEHGERRTDPWGWLYREDGPVERVPPPAAAPPVHHPAPQSYAEPAPQSYAEPAPQSYAEPAPQSYAEPEDRVRPDPQPGYGYGPPGEIPDYQAPETDHEPTAAPATSGPVYGRVAGAEQVQPRGSRRGLMIGLIAGVLALVLIIAVVLVGWSRSLNTSSGSSEPTGPGSVPADSTPSDQPSDQPSAAPSPAPTHTGPVKPITPTGASAGCVAPDATDGNGDPVTYVAGNAVDGDLDTAWRCDGDGAGESLRVALPAGAEVARLGLLNGYTKVDPATEDRRYQEYRRITTVRWELSTGTTFDQQLQDQTESMQTLDIPVHRDVEWVQVTVTISTSPGSDAATRDAVLISEIQVSAPV